MYRITIKLNTQIQTSRENSDFNLYLLLLEFIDRRVFRRRS